MRSQIWSVSGLLVVLGGGMSGNCTAEGPPQEDVGLEPYALDPRLNPRPEPADTSALLGTTIPVGAPR